MFFARAAVVAYLLMIAGAVHAQNIPGSTGLEKHATAAQFSEPPRIDPPAEPKMERYPGTIEIKAGETSSSERAQALVGSQYTVITPLFFGAGNNYSFFRLSNIGSTNATFRATLIGSPTGRNYGTVNVTVAPYASPQYSISDVFATLGITGAASNDYVLSLYVQSPQVGQVSFQHVVWNSTTGFFENASICTYVSAINYSVLNHALFNVHTSQLPAYPSSIFLHNYASVPISYKLDVFKARNGAYIGSVYYNLGANDTGTEDFSTTERTLGYTPADGDYHVNIFFSTTSSAGYNGITASAINNLQLNSLTNMTVSCAINP